MLQWIFLHNLNTMYYVIEYFMYFIMDLEQIQVFVIINQGWIDFWMDFEINCRFKINYDTNEFQVKGGKDYDINLSHHLFIS